MKATRLLTFFKLNQYFFTVYLLLEMRLLCHLCSVKMSWYCMEWFFLLHILPLILCGTTDANKEPLYYRVWNRSIAQGPLQWEKRLFRLLKCFSQW